MIRMHKMIIRNYSFRNRGTIQVGGSIKELKLEYNKMIELKFKVLETNKDELEIYLSNEIDKNKINENNSCIFIQINKENQVAHIHGISSSSLLNCFSDSEFILKKPGSFYLNMSVKMLKKYKDKLKINKITLLDNAMIYVKDGNNYNLSQFKLLTEGKTWYEKYGFKINKEKRKQHLINKKIIEGLKTKDIKLKNIILNVKHEKLPLNYLKSIVKYIKLNKEENLMETLYGIFVDKRNEYTNLLYSLIINQLLRNIEKNFDDYERFKPETFYYRL